MKQRRSNATLTIAVLALTIFLILTTLPLAGTAAPRLERRPLGSLTALNSTEATESGAPLSVFSALSGISGSIPPAWPSSMRWYSEGSWRFTRVRGRGHAG